MREKWKDFFVGFALEEEIYWIFFLLFPFQSSQKSSLSMDFSSILIGNETKTNLKLNRDAGERERSQRRVEPKTRDNAYKGCVEQIDFESWKMR